MDGSLRDADRLEIGYRPEILDDIEPGGLYVVRGPRRVGKSVAVKRRVARLLEEGVAPHRVIYMALNDFSQQDLRRLLVLARSMTQREGDQSVRYWVLDEISAVPGWSSVVKDARDETPLRDDTVVLTGSSAGDLLDARRDLGAGRVGDIEEPFRILLPMPFRAVARVLYPELPDVEPVGPCRLQSPEAKLAARALEPYVNELDLAWQGYLECGGFPRAVAEHVKEGSVGRAFARDLRDWLAPDVVPGARPDSVVELLSSLAARSGAPLNVSSLARDVGVGRKQLEARLNRLRLTFGAFEVPQVNERGTRVDGSQSKWYLLDPLLAELPAMLDVGLPTSDATQRTEAALGLHMARAVDRLHPDRLVEGRAVGYARTGSGNEVDFSPVPVRTGGVQVTTTPLESKWVPDGWRREALTVEGKFGAGVVATKSILDTEHPAWAIPAPIVAMLLV